MISRPELDEHGVEKPDKWVHEAVNSCLRPLASVHRQLVTTVRRSRLLDSPPPKSRLSLISFY